MSDVAELIWANKWNRVPYEEQEAMCIQTPKQKSSVAHWPICDICKRPIHPNDAKYYHLGNFQTCCQNCYNQQSLQHHWQQYGSRT